MECYTGLIDVWNMMYVARMFSTEVSIKYEIRIRAIRKCQINGIFSSYHSHTYSFEAAGIEKHGQIYWTSLRLSAKLVTVTYKIKIASGHRVTIAVTTITVIDIIFQFSQRRPSFRLHASEVSRWRIKSLLLSILIASLHINFNLLQISFLGA